MTVVSGDEYNSSFAVENILTKESNYWLAPVDTKSQFILDLGCIHTFDGIQLVNTHNANYKDKGTKKFRYMKRHAVGGVIWRQFYPCKCYYMFLIETN